MANTTTNMSLAQWNLATDIFDYTQLSTNFDKIDKHDHTGAGVNGGVQIPTAGIAPLAIDNSRLASNSVDSTKIQAASINADRLAVGVQPALVSTLPTTTTWDATYNGYEVYYQSSSMLSSDPYAIWHLRFQYASGASKWVYIGGNEMSSIQNPDSFGTRSTSEINYGVLNTGTTASVTAPLIGSYKVDIHGVIGRASITGSAAGRVYMSVQNGSATTLDKDGWSEYISVVGSDKPATGYVSNTMVTVADSSTFTCNFKAANTGTDSDKNDITVNRHGIRIKPVYINAF